MVGADCTGSLAPALRFLPLPLRLDEGSNGVFSTTRFTLKLAIISLDDSMVSHGPENYVKCKIQSHLADLRLLPEVHGSFCEHFEVGVDLTSSNICSRKE